MSRRKKIKNTVLCDKCRRSLDDADDWEMIFNSLKDQFNLDEVKDTIDKLMEIGATVEAKELSRIVTANTGETPNVVKANDRFAVKLLRQAEIAAKNTPLRAKLALLRHQVEKEIWRN